MGNLSTRILFGIILTVIAFFIIYSAITYKQPTLKTVELDDKSNLVFNQTEHLFYDTIILTGLEILGIQDVGVTVQPITENAKKDFASQGGELSAHIREYLGSYYLFIDETSKIETIDIISHELIHLKQYESGRLKYSNDTLTWDGKSYTRTEIPYGQRPWEIDAEKKEIELSEKIKQVLLY